MTATNNYRSSSNMLPLVFGVLVSLIFASVTGAPAVRAGEQQSADERIAGGVTAAGPKDYPYYVAVTVKDQHKCGGFIYNDRFILTAASCINGFQPIDVTVTVGAYSLIVPDPDEQYIPALSLKPHESFNLTGHLENDIGLIQLGRPVVFDAVNVWFLHYDDVSDVDKTAIVMGWGAINDGGLPYASRLRVASQMIDDTNFNKCGSYSTDEFNSNYMICAVPDDAGEFLAGTPCDFDQGSPLVQKQDGVQFGVAVGIMSKVKECNPADAATLEPTIYTRLTAYYSWLRTNAGQQPAFTTTAAPGRR